MAHHLPVTLLIDKATVMARFWITVHTGTNVAYRTPSQVNDPESSSQVNDSNEVVIRQFGDQHVKEKEGEGERAHLLKIGVGENWETGRLRLRKKSGRCSDRHQSAVNSTAYQLHQTYRFRLHVQCITVTMRLSQCVRT